MPFAAMAAPAISQAFERYISEDKAIPPKTIPTHTGIGHMSKMVLIAIGPKVQWATQALDKPRNAMSQTPLTKILSPSTA